MTISLNIGNIEQLGYKHTECQCQQQRQGPLECIVTLENCGGGGDFQCIPMGLDAAADADARCGYRLNSRRIRTRLPPAKECEKGNVFS